MGTLRFCYDSAMGVLRVKARFSLRRRSRNTISNWRHEESHLPSQKQLKWSQLRVGITVIVASLTLGFLLFLMSGTAGLFTPRITLKSYFDNAEGLRVGAPVRLSGVDIGNVTQHRDRTGQRQATDSGRSHDEGQHEVRLQSASGFVTSLETAGVLGETYLDIDSSQALGTPVQDGDTLPTQVHPDFNQVVRASQSTLQNMDALLKRADRILAFAESGKGSSES